jgi:hypothetical protein
MATMIKNERQYRITKAHAEKFAHALHELTTTRKRRVHPVLHKAQIDALKVSGWRAALLTKPIEVRA